MKHSKQLESFSENFFSLTPKQQRIWKYLQFMARKHAAVFPSQSTIAKACSCHRDTVIEAIKQFVRLGWLEKVKRGYTSCVYLLLKPLIWICEKTAEKIFPEKSDNNPTLDINYSFSRERTNNEENDTVQKLAMKEIVFSKGDHVIFRSLAKKNKEAMEKALEDCLAFSGKEGIRNPGAFVTARWKAHNTASLEVVEEVKHLDIPENDKKILTKYSKENRKAFLFALEDFSTYKISQKVKNIAAFITNRFKSYVNGNEGGNEEKTVKRSDVESLLSNILFPKEISVCVGERYVEISGGQWCRHFDFSDPKFEIKLNSLLSKFRHFKKT